MTVEQLTDSLRETLAVFDGPNRGTPLTTSEVTDRLDIGRRSTYDRLRRLADRDYLETKKVGARGRIWWRPGVSSVEKGGTDGTNRTAELGLGGLLDSADVGVVVLDEDREVVWSNETYERYFDLDQGDAVERDLRALGDERTASAVGGPASSADDVLTASGDITHADQSPYLVVAGSGREERWLGYRREPIRSGPYAGGHVELYYDATDERDGATDEREAVECRERESAVRRERDRLLQVLEAAPVGVGVFRPDGSVDLSNARFDGYRLSGDGCEDDTTAGLELFDANGEPLSDSATPTGRVVETGEPVSDREIRVERPGGETRWLSVNAVPVTDDDGALERVVTTATDVTPFRGEIRRLERQREALQSEFEEMYNRITDAFLTLDADWRFTHLNEQAEELLGRTEAELRGEYVWDEYPEAAERSYKERFERAMETQEPITFEEYSAAVETWLEVRVYPSSSGLSIYFRDIAERKGRERALEESERQYRAIAENFPNGAVVMFDGNLRYTLVEGDLPKALGVGDEWVGEPVGDVLLPEARDAFVSRYRAALEGEASSFEVEYGDRILHVKALPVRDEHGEVFAGMGMSQDVTEQRLREREHEQQRERLTALNHLNDLVHEVTDAAIEQSTREEIETIICERLAASDSYQYAWIGDVDVPTLTVNPRAKAGVEGYLDEVTLTIDPNDESNNGATARAALEREVQVTRDSGSQPRDDDRREHSLEYGFRSSAAIPIVYDDTLYDVLNVYTDRPDAFTDEELDVIGRLGEIVGHAIAAVQRKRALMSDEVVELELQIQDVLETVDVHVSFDGSITFDRTVPVGDGVYHEYGIATGNAIDAVEAVVESDRHPNWESLRLLEDDGEEVHFELRLLEPPLISTVSAFNGYIQTSRIEDGDYYVRVHLPPSADVRTVVDTIKDGYPELEIATHRQVSRDPEPETRYRGTLLEKLTERQRSAVEMAYLRGYFEWPRDSTGEDIADLLGVTPSTFHQHLRKAESRLFTAMFGEGRSSGTA